MVRIGNRFNLKLPKLVSLILLCFVMLFTGCSNDTNTSNVTIIMNKKETTLVVGQEQNLKAITSPKGVSVTWESENPDIVSVSTTGRIKGEKVGQTTIKATAGSKIATCLVTVEQITVSLSAKTVIIDVSEKLTYQLEATNSKNLSGSYVWTSSNEGVATVDEDGLVTAVSKGQTTIKAAKGDAFDTCEVTVTAPEDYYVLSNGRNADVYKDAGKWYYYSTAKDISGYHANGKVTLNNNTTKSAEHFLRYMPSGFTAGDIVNVSFNVESSVGGYLRFGAKSSGTDQEKEIFMVKIEANTPTDVKFESCTIEQDKPFSVSMCSSDNWSNYMSGPYTLKCTDFVVEKSLAIKINEGEKLINLSNKTYDVQLATGTVNLNVYGNTEEVTWSSSDEEVATVNNGVVTLLKGGNVDIIATSGEMKTKTTLNIASQSLELSKTKIILDLTNNVIQETIIATTEGLTEEVTWTSLNNEIATVDNGVITAHKGGSTKVVVSSGLLSKECLVIVMSNETQIKDTVEPLANVSNDTDTPADNWYTKNNKFSTSNVFNMNEGTLTGTIGKAITTTTPINVRYLPKNGENIYNGKFFFKMDVTNNTETDLTFTYEIGAQKGQTKTVNIKQNETFTFKVTFTSDGTLSGSFVNLKLKKPALGTIVMNNIHFIGLGE